MPKPLRLGSGKRNILAASRSRLIRPVAALALLAILRQWRGALRRIDPG